MVSRYSLKILISYSVFFEVSSFSFSLENLTKSLSEMPPNCREAAIAKNRQEGAKRQKAGTPGGRGHVLIWPKRVCAAQQGMVFRVLRLKPGIQFFYLAS